MSIDVAFEAKSIGVLTFWGVDIIDSIVYIPFLREIFQSRSLITSPINRLNNSDHLSLTGKNNVGIYQAVSRNENKRQRNKQTGISKNTQIIKRM
jgi:hypothetical protein